MKRIAAAALLLAIAGVAAAAPRMAGFDALAAEAERLDVTGIGWGRGGRFKLGAATGEFRRGLDRRDFDVEGRGLVEHAGGLTFSVGGPGVSGRLEGRCAIRQAQEQVRSSRLTISEPVMPLNYRCAFSVDGAPAGEMALDAVFSRGVTVKSERAGIVRMGENTLAIRSVHRFEGGKLPTSSPLGYVLKHDGRAVAAVDVNGGRKRLLLPRDARTRDAALAAGLALSLFWDPGDQD